MLPDQLAAVLARVAAEDLAALADYLQTAPRMAARDGCIRAALSRFYCAEPKTPAAKRMAADLQTPPAPGTALGDAIAAILALNRGRSMSWRQILAISDGWRGH